MMKVLVIDDNPDIRNLIQVTLKKTDIDVTLCESGEKGLELLSTSYFHLIILDIIMPGMDGYAVCDRIKSNPETQHIPIIFLSAKDETDSLVKGLKAGAVDYIAKPFQKEELIARINVHLDLQKSKQLLKNQLEENRQLIHILSHDLKNPIGSVLSILELMEVDPDEAEEYRAYIQTSISEGIQIIDSVRNFLALEEGKGQLTLECFSLLNLINRSYQILENRFKAKNINLKIQVPEHIKVNVDQVTFVNSVLSNLLTNAIKFSFTGENIILNATELDNWIELTIIDHGIGIPTQMQTDMFNIQKQTSRPGTEGESGTGFGMPLVKKFIESYGGSIEIFSVEHTENSTNHGTTFKIKLPKG